jgi:hypothetical protein
MISHLFLGFSKGYRKLHKKYGYCLMCNKYSECEITVLESTLKMFTKTIRDNPEAYLFDWAECDHRVGIFNKEDVKRYKEEQVLTENYAIPYKQAYKIS